MADVNNMNLAVEDSIENKIWETPGDEHSNVFEAGFAAREREVRQAIELAIEGELGKRPRGGRITRWISLIPVVGVAGKYLGEWSGLKKAEKAGEEWIHSRRG